MISVEVLRDAEQRRLTWRCRRGMLELDIVLQRFVKEKFNALSLSELEMFDGLLELPDNELWALIRSNKQHEDKVLNIVVTKLNAANLSALKDS